MAAQMGDRAYQVHRYPFTEPEVRPAT
jgi:hypothetical protein